jgi:hypothetical protein
MLVSGRINEVLQINFKGQFGSKEVCSKEVTLTCEKLDDHKQLQVIPKMLFLEKVDSEQASFFLSYAPNSFNLLMKSKGYSGVMVAPYSLEVWIYEGEKLIFYENKGEITQHPLKIKMDGIGACRREYMDKMRIKYKIMTSQKDFMGNMSNSNINVRLREGFTNNETISVESENIISIPWPRNSTSEEDIKKELSQFITMEVKNESTMDAAAVNFSDKSSISDLIPKIWDVLIYNVKQVLPTAKILPGRFDSMCFNDVSSKSKAHDFNKAKTLQNVSDVERQETDINLKSHSSALSNSDSNSHSVHAAVSLGLQNSAFIPGVGGGSESKNSAGSGGSANANAKHTSNANSTNNVQERHRSSKEYHSNLNQSNNGEKNLTSDSSQKSVQINGVGFSNGKLTINIAQIMAFTTSVTEKSKKYINGVDQLLTYEGNIYCSEVIISCPNLKTFKELVNKVDNCSSFYNHDTVSELLKHFPVSSVEWHDERLLDKMLRRAILNSFNLRD